MSAIQKKIDGINLEDVDTFYKSVAKIGAGASFGELAIIDTKNRKRNARIVAFEDTYLGVINYENYHRCLAKIEKQKRDQMLSILDRMPFF